MVSTTGLQPTICKHQSLCSKHYLCATKNLFQDVVKRICAPEAVLVEADGGLGTQAAVRQRRRIGTLAPLQARQQLAAVCKSHLVLKVDFRKALQIPHATMHRGPRKIGTLAPLQARQQLAAVCKSHKPLEFCSRYLRNDWSKESADSPIKGAQGPLQVWEFCSATGLAAACRCLHTGNQTTLNNPDVTPWKGTTNFHGGEPFRN